MLILEKFTNEFISKNQFIHLTKGIIKSNN